MNINADRPDRDNITGLIGFSGYSGGGEFFNTSGYSGRSGYSGCSVLIEAAVIIDKPVKTKLAPKNGYYTAKEEDAVVRFLSSDDFEEKRRIYREELQFPIHKMIESIIRTYRLYRKDFNFEDLHADALSFLITKFEKFDPSMGHKSFSYFGTICRNYLYGEMIKAYKKSIRTLGYEDVVHDLMQRDDMITYIDQEDIDMANFLKKLIVEIETEMEDEKLNENEYKIGVSLIQILNDWDVLFEDFVGTTKFNKNLILYWLREMTGLNTKEIRNAMRRYKSLYFLFKNNYIT